MLYAFCSYCLVILLMLVIGLLSKKSETSTSKGSPFECGFVPFQNSRTPFSIQFFLISLVFLIFDVELILLFPVLLEGFQVKGFIFSGYFLFLIILMYGLILEWSQGSLEWLK